jgi:eukaryotic-like serine/threonine-protein kinase
VGSVDIGALLDERYRITNRRAAGATATVWAAEDEFLRRLVAIKILHGHLAADADFLARFVEEARTAATVNHPALVAVYDSISIRPGIVLEWIDGPDLRQRLDQGPIPADDVATIGATICDGLSALHEQRLIHRDVKPANILLTADGRPKLTDFGIATANAGDRTATGIVLGTAKYLAPEQVRGAELDGRTDVFALAAVLYEALAGRPPWVREGDLPTALARLEEDPADLCDLRPDIPVSLAATVTRGLAREPDARWPSAAAFAAALRGGSTLPPPPTRPLATASAPGRPPAETPPSERALSDRTLLTASVSTAAPSMTRARTETTGPPVRPRRRWWPRVLGFLVLLAIAALGWTLVVAISATSAPESEATVGEPDRGDALTLVRAAAFDPEGVGTPGEHDERAPLAIDGDPGTAWPTERYESRDLGTKSGVGLVIGLDGITDIAEITIRTVDARSWAAEIHVVTGPIPDDAGIADFGAPVVRASDLDSTAVIPINARGDTVVVWIIDLGAGSVPIRLEIAEVTIR